MPPQLFLECTRHGSRPWARNRKNPLSGSLAKVFEIGATFGRHHECGGDGEHTEMATGWMNGIAPASGSSTRKANARALLVQGRDSFGLSSVCFCQGASFSALPAAVFKILTRTCPLAASITVMTSPDLS